MQNDAAILIILSGTVLISVFLIILATKRNWIEIWLCRKILHVIAIGACAVAPVLLEELLALKIIVAVVIPVLFFVVKKDLILPENAGTRSYGIPLFALAYLILLLIFTENRLLIFSAMAALAVCDAMAAIAGNLIPFKAYTLTGDKKTISGSICFFLSFLLLFALIRKVFPGFLTQVPDEKFWAALPLFALILTLLEALGRKGWDNFLIPLVASALFWRLDHASYYIKYDEIMFWYAAAFVALIFCIITIRLKFLSANGGVMASLIGAWIVIIAHYYFLFPLMYYFISSVLIGKISGRKSKASDEKQGKPRDWVQVWSNGGLYAILMISFRTMDDPGPMMPGFSLICGIPVCVAVADTWASEIGSRFKGKVIDIVKCKPVNAGISGGISLVGTISGLTSAILFAGLFVYFNPLMGSFELWWFHFVVLSLAGFSGMLIDSVLGSLFQAKYRKADGNLSDHATESGALVSGYQWMTNDMVNQLSILITFILSLLVLGLFK